MTSLSAMPIVRGISVCARTSVRVLVAMIATLSLLSLPLFSQGNAGRILGTITDATGAVIVGATVTVTDVQRGVSRPLTTDGAGEYTAPNLLPGMYSVRAEAQGFKTVERQNIRLEINQDVRIDLSLEPGQQTQTITVTEAVPLTETTNAELGGTLQGEIIDSLPLNGRNFENMLQLRPGVVMYPGGSGWTQSTNGIRAHDNLYMVNGINASDPWMGQSVMNAPMAGGDAGTMLSVDAIDEFQTEQNPRAEYGWKPGSVVNVGIKSGTNNIHGTAFAFGRDTAFDARNYFDQAPAPKAPLNLEQYGGTFGGPIKKDKLFYFASFEAQQYSIANPAQHKFPITCAGGSAGCGLAATSTANSLVDACMAAAKAAAPAQLTHLSAELAGLSFNSATLGTPTPTGNCVPTVTESQVLTGEPANGFLGLFPENNSGSTAVFTAMPGTNTLNGGLGKIDYHLNDHHSIEGMYFISEGNPLAVDAPTSEIANPWLTQEHARSQAASGSWTWTPNSAWVNEARFGYAHYYQSFYSNDHTDNPENYTFKGQTFVFPSGITNPFYFGMPAINDGFGGTRNGIGGSWPKVVGPDAVYTIVDHISFLRGKHAFKFGGEVLYNQSGEDVTSNGKGPVSFGGGTKALVNFFEGTMSSANLFTGNPARTLSTTGYAGFFQDDWRLRPTLTVNLGIRYELTTVMKDANNQLGNFLPSLGVVQVGDQIGSAYNGDHNNFSPRLGFAWDVQGNGKTVVRAGGSIIYESQISFDVTNGIGNLLGLRTIPTGLPLYNNGSTTPLTPPGNINTVSISYTGSALTAAGGLNSVWRAFNPAQPISASNASLYGSAASNSACGDGVIKPPGFLKAPATCNIVGIIQNLRTPYIENWNLDIQRAITSSLSLDVGYVGNHGVKLLGKLDENQPQFVNGFSPGWGNPAVVGTPAYVCIQTAGATCTSSGAAEQAARPFTAACSNAALFGAIGAGTPGGSGGAFNPGNNCYSYLKNIAIINNNYTAMYDGLQATLTSRNYHGLTTTVGYTYSHALGEASDQGTSGDFPLPLNSYGNVHSQLYGASAFDIRHRGTLSVNYVLPGKPGYAQMLEGWSVNSIVLLQSGSPWGLADVTDDFSGTSEGISNGAGSEGEQWDFFGNPSDFTPVHGWTNTNSGAGGLPYFTGTTSATCVSAVQSHFTGTQQQLAMASLTNLGCYAVGNSVLVPPPYGSYGTTPRNLFRDAGFRDWDFSVTKEVKFKERLTAQARAEFFNILNHPIFANPTGGPGGGTEDPSAGIPFGTQGATPDVLSSDPELGSGGPRSIQLGLKLIF